ncbi:Permease of the drug/metabolite transporter (DMT) superfamily [Salimicrobium salexigens]|uniref:Permease of the drug/metabolite transporter (DMT) superfamily n=1 Tax=Salimicrobium salexigens TaxID=908941 RepID=A0ABY1KXH0_9BACI|nr:Permease of the drug/metabolite transporter (DMT) superfamily [Salimicrobium salexigens]
MLLLGLASFTKKRVNRLGKTEWIAISVLGIIGVFINQWSFFVGLETADPTTSALILATTPILAGVLGATFLKERLTIRMLLGSVIAITGIFLVVTKGSFTVLQVDRGLLWIVVTMITFAIMIIMTRVLSKRIDPLPITLYSNIIGFLISIPFVFMWDDPIRFGVTTFDWAFLIGTAITVHGIATLIWNTNIRQVDASKASILSNLEPFLAMITGLVLLHKPITDVEIAGALLIVGGVIFSTYQRKRRITGQRLPTH